jgi:hypothetical protein
MRFENNVLHLKSSVSGTDDADDRTGLARSSAVSLSVAGKTGLQQKPLVPDACPHVVPAALSRLLAQVLGGFTGYREAMNSALFTRVADYSENLTYLDATAAASAARASELDVTRPPSASNCE